MGTDHAQNYLDLVALSLVADMMDLREYETKHLINLGLKQITNPYFKGMTIKNEYSLGGKVTPFGVAFYIAPYVNAVTRSGTMEEKIVLFESMLEFKAYEMIPSIKRGHKPGEMETRVEQACRNCTNIKNRQTKTRDASLEIIEQLIEEQNLLDNKVLLIKLGEAQRTTLGGLIANQLMSIYQRPVLILSKTEHDVLDEQGKVVDTEIWWEGSGRGPNVPGLEDCKAFYESSGLVEYGQG
jgi:single-stranded-DNA-specific exonuclease